MRKFSEKGSIVLCVLWMMLILQFCLSIACIQKEYEALLQLKKSFVDPSHRLASWNGKNCCNWKGLGCYPTTGHVTWIDLRNNNQVFIYDNTSLYSNSIDSSLLELKYLNYLDLSMNNFNHTQIPNFLGLMVELRYLNLSRAFFSGTVLPNLGNLTKLNTLDLSYNLLQPNGNVEWISHLSSLQFLRLSETDFSKVSNFMQLIICLPLLSLKMSSCSLQNIHFSLGSSNSSFLTRIQLLNLSYNKLNGPIPKAFQNMTSLKFLYLSGNKFTYIEGGLSSLIRHSCELKVFDFSWNYDLEGDVFGSNENESMSCINGHDLQLLDLSATSIRSKVPDWLGKFKNLKTLYLHDSSIYGLIPASLGNLSSLEYLDLSSNVLSGAIPTSFGRLYNLRILFLSENRLEGVTDECFIQLENLEWLDMSENLLEGILTDVGFANLSCLNKLVIGHNELLLLEMNPNWVPPFQLKFFYATSCIGCFGSEFPQWLQTQKSLTDLFMSNMSISSAIPTWLTLPNLNTLVLSHNKMVGPLFINIANQMPHLKQLYLNDNLINDPLLSSLCKLKSLFILDLSNNRLSGVVRGCLLIPNLAILDLSSNNFSGSFPYSRENFLSNIEQLYLRNNNFEGTIPIVLKNSRRLQFLDLQGNKFSGNIPTWIGNDLISLEFLRLRENLFNGTIPSSLCKLTNLQMLDLAHNQLEGSIPPNLSNFDAMINGRIYGLSFYCMSSDLNYCFNGEKDILQYIKSNDLNYTMIQLRSMMVNIDLSNNYLVGFIPREIGMLKALFGLNLSHNNLNGTIPTEIGDMEALESLDLSFNQLSGQIPRSISKLSTLGTLKLSHNNLFGKIPREGQLSTFNEASSFDDNPYLCGDPLPLKCGIENPSKPPIKNIDNLDPEEDKWEKCLLLHHDSIWIYSWILGGCWKFNI